MNAIENNTIDVKCGKQSIVVFIQRVYMKRVLQTLSFKYFADLRSLRVGGEEVGIYQFA